MKPHKEGYAEPIFQLLNMAAYGAVGYGKLGSGLAETLESCRRLKGLDGIQGRKPVPRHVICPNIARGRFAFTPAVSDDTLRPFRLPAVQRKKGGCPFDGAVVWLAEGRNHLRLKKPDTLSLIATQYLKHGKWQCPSYNENSTLGPNNVRYSVQADAPSSRSVFDSR
jgi:hypothetical protein